MMATVRYSTSWRMHGNIYLNRVHQSLQSFPQLHQYVPIPLTKRSLVKSQATSPDERGWNDLLGVPLRWLNTVTDTPLSSIHGPYRRKPFKPYLTQWLFVRFSFITIWEHLQTILSGEIQNRAESLLSWCTHKLWISPNYEKRRHLCVWNQRISLFFKTIEVSFFISQRKKKKEPNP
jgi:hypothetical protein